MNTIQFQYRKTPEQITDREAIILSAPNTSSLFLFTLTLFAFNSAKFLDIIVGVAPSFSKLSLTGSSSIFEGSTVHLNPFSYKIFFLISLLDASTTLYIFFFYFINLNDRNCCFLNRLSSNINSRPFIFFKCFLCFFNFIFNRFYICIICSMFFI